MRWKANFSFFFYVLEETTLAMLKKYYFLFLAALLAVSCQKASDNPRTPPPPPQFSQRIKQVIRHTNYIGTPYPEGISSTEYFYDTQGRVDSIAKQKILYGHFYQWSGRKGVAL